jgi:hypothetical protein
MDFIIDLYHIFGYWAKVPINSCYLLSDAKIKIIVMRQVKIKNSLVHLVCFFIILIIINLAIN